MHQRRRRTSLLASVVALGLPLALVVGGPHPALAAPAAPTAPAAPATTADPASDPAAEAALRELRADADGAVTVARDEDGRVAQVRSRDGEAMLESTATTPRAAVVEQLGRHGEAFGIDGDDSTVRVTQALPSATGGSVVRAAQRVDGVPVLGGQVVVSLDGSQDVVSVEAATTTATSVAPTEVGQDRARRTALSTVAKRHGVPADRLRADDLGRELYDPALVGATDPAGTRPVWHFEVVDGGGIRETVLVGTQRGEVALRFDAAPDLDRVVCDGRNRRTGNPFGSVSSCVSPARREGSPVSGVADVDAAYDAVGATSQTYDDLAGVDLTELVGTEVAGRPALLSTVRFCLDEPADVSPCPLDNAFWDGAQVVLGGGFAQADDVVGHELTHGFVERTSGLFYLYQAGSLNESLSDVVGELVDHRNPLSTQDDSGWTIGEDLPGDDSLRSLADPTLAGQPDRMTSPAFTTDVEDVHTNGGIGNKTAYLISQGGTFNGQSVRGIDAGDPSLARTGALYLATIPRLTSGADFAALGRTLVATCDELAAGGSPAALTTDDCTSVRAAVTATELAQAPRRGAAAPTVPVACPSGATMRDDAVRRDDDGLDGFGLDSTSALWSRVPSGDVPAFASSGRESLFGYSPDPQTGTGSSAELVTAPFTVPTASGGSYLHFDHAHDFEAYEGTYYDGGEVVVSELVGSTWRRVSGLTWVNGPTRRIVGNTRAGFTGWGGDSRGYGSSQVDLEPLAGRTVKVAFRTVGDESDSATGWFLDDVRLYTCDSVLPAAPRVTGQTAGAGSATVTWAAGYLGEGLTGWRVTRPNGTSTDLAASARTVTLSGLDTAATQRVVVTALGQGGTPGGSTTATFTPTAAAASTSVTRVAARRAFTVTGRVTARGTSTALSGRPVVLQRKASGASSWSTVSTGTTGSTGARSWSVTQTRSTYYRVVVTPSGAWFGSTSATRLVRMR